MAIHWFMQHSEDSTFGERVADSVATFIGSWKFIILQATLMSFWLVANVIAYGLLRYIDFDPYPFILLNLFMSAEAAFSTPLIMMSQNRQSQRDRAQADADYKTNLEAERRIEELQLSIAKLEDEKHQEILAAIQSLK